MAGKFLPIKSTVPGKIPLPGDLDIGELAVNTADGKLFTKHNDNSIKELAGGGGGGGGGSGARVLISDTGNLAGLNATSVEFSLPFDTYMGLRIEGVFSPASQAVPNVRMSVDNGATYVSTNNYMYSGISFASDTGTGATLQTSGLISETSSFSLFHNATGPWNFRVRSMEIGDPFLYNSQYYTPVTFRQDADHFGRMQFAMSVGHFRHASKPNRLRITNGFVMNSGRFVVTGILK